MTTEDNGFFKHRGWVTPEFKTALRRNLAGGGFRLGASSITMQMVKNVLLSREKTLSRKLQELFLVWYIEKMLPKERILELYFNAIEFGPRIYGIGAAARHYFGKHASADHAAGGGVLLVDHAQPEAALHPVLPRAAVPALGQVRAAHPAAGARARAPDGRGIRPGRRPRRSQFDLTARGMSEPECQPGSRRSPPAIPEPPPAGATLENFRFVPRPSRFRGSPQVCHSATISRL